MGKTVICVDTGTVDNYLSAGISSDKLLIHNDPHVSFDSESGVRANFDYYLDTGFCSRLTADAIELLGHRYIDARRLPKRRQLMLARRLGINTPRFGFIPYLDSCYTDTNLQCALVSRMGFGPGDKILVKGDNCARGMAQAVVDYEDFYRFCETFLKESAPSLDPDADWYVLGGGDTDRSDPCNVEVFKQPGGHYTFNELIDVQREYRLLFNCARGRILATRSSHEQAGFQSRYVGGREVPLADALPPEVIEPLDALIDATGLPFGSIDLYLDRAGNWGVFEFCPQFGYVKPHAIRETITLMTSGIEHLLERKARSTRRGGPPAGGSSSGGEAANARSGQNEWDSVLFDPGAGRFGRGSKDRWSSG